MTGNRAAENLLIGAVRVYQIVLSPFLGGSCRFHPSCSNYAIQALRERGALPGAWLAIRRIVRCQPLSPGGFDPVPAGERRGP